MKLGLLHVRTPLCHIHLPCQSVILHLPTPNSECPISNLCDLRRLDSHSGLQHLLLRLDHRRVSSGILPMGAVQWPCEGTMQTGNIYGLRYLRSWYGDVLG